MSALNDLTPVLKRLRLSGILESLDLRLQQAVDDDIHHTEFLYRVLFDELERRDAKRLDLRTKKVRFESLKAIDDFDWRFNPNIPKQKVIDLATCAFIEKNENVFLVGLTGTGKSHLAQALGKRAIGASMTCFT
ncbi:MAG: ATP-binding protein [Deltaproteobacteria bacterium]|nr:ATP-binding protein [Deltaproteobacteria bacterium]